MGGGHDIVKKQVGRRGTGNEGKTLRRGQKVNAMVSHTGWEHRTNWVGKGEDKPQLPKIGIEAEMGRGKKKASVKP